MSGAVHKSPSNDREKEVAEAAEWLVERHGYDRAEAQLLFALGVVRRLRYENGGEAGE